jgi:integrase
MNNLTELKLKNLIKKGEAIAISDGGGLTFTLSKEGAKRGQGSWVLRYTFNGKKKELTLSKYPAISLKDARLMAEKERTRIAKGIDVAQVKQENKHEESKVYNFEAVTQTWLNAEILASDIKHKNIPQRVITHNLLPVFTGHDIRTITHKQIDTLLTDIVARGAPTVANDVLHYLKRIFKYAVRKRLLEVNILWDYTAKDAGGTEKKRERYLKQEELATLFVAMRETRNFGRQNEIAVHLLLMLCVRKMELLAAKWDDFNLKQGLWLLNGNNKTGKELAIPLPMQAIPLLHELKVFACGSPYLFPSRLVRQNQRFGHVSPDTLNLALTRLDLSDIEHFTVHDMRRTARTHLSILGVASDIAERALNHTIKGMEAHYNQYQFLRERKEALDKWADFLERCANGQHYNVIQGQFTKAVS